ncbi:hypothetical protein, conserved [Eimeria acervulina]|uniref:Uncharacterized protein n=1 Tax=Eimeria acervulina TaxID=5801 RepID=U6GRC3_EIMAC|nr:hypothetical protein, conserved [Eimeria acervulina]CDI82806.1 hypothetical protein, conserved [Eimeria acervulina]
MASAGAANFAATSPSERHIGSPASIQPQALESRAASSPGSRSVLSNTSRAAHGNSSNEGCYLVTMGLCAHVHAKNAQVAAAVAADAAAGAATDSGHSEAAKIGSLYISSVPAQKHRKHIEHDSHEQQVQQQHQQLAPHSLEHVSLPHGAQAHEPPPHPPSFCTIHLDNSDAYGVGNAATEAVIGAVARAAAAEISLAAAEAGNSECSSLSGDPPESPDGSLREKEAKGVVGVDLPDLKNIPLAIRVPPYREHLLYELKQLRHFWKVDLHQRDWRQVFVCSYFPNAIDPAFLTLLRTFCCITVLVLECFASIQGYKEVGKAQMLYFTNWNSLLVAAGFLSLTITSIIACMSFAAPLQPCSGSTSDPQQQQPRRRHVQLPPEPQQYQQQRQQRQTQVLMNSVEEASPTYSLNYIQPNAPNVASRESSTCSLGFSALEFVAVDGRHPRPTYSSSKAALLPWLVQQRQQLLQQQRQPRDSRALCLVLQGYRDLMADSRCCVEGILLAPNPSNKCVSRVQASASETGASRRLARKRAVDRQQRNRSSPPVCVSAHALTAWSSGAADSGPTCSTGSRNAVSSASMESEAQAAAAAATAAAAAASQRSGSTAAAPVDVPWFVKVTWVVHNLQLVASLGVAAVFFSLFKAEDVQFPGSWVTVWKHSVLVLLTLLHASLLSRIPCPMRHMGYTIILFFCYLVLQLCVFLFKVPNGQGGVGYVYKVFCLSEPLKAMIVLASIFLCCFLMHLFLWSISRKRCLYVDPPPSVSVTALQLKRSIRYAAAAAAAAAAAEQMASESSAVVASAETLPKDSLVRLHLHQHPCCSEQASTGNPDGRQSGSSGSIKSTGRDGLQSEGSGGQQAQVQTQ